MTKINVTLKEVRAEISKDEELRSAPPILQQRAILAFLGVIEGDDQYMMTERSKAAIEKYAHGLV